MLGEVIGNLGVGGPGDPAPSLEVVDVGATGSPRRGGDAGLLSKPPGAHFEPLRTANRFYLTSQENLHLTAILVS
jgi:hypothetical protein